MAASGVKSSSGIQNDPGVLSYFSSSGEIKSPWNRMLSFSGSKALVTSRSLILAASGMLSAYRSRSQVNRGRW